MDLNSAAYFVQIVRSGSFTQASKTLGIPKSTLSDKIAELEKDLGVTLLMRTTRKLSLSQPGTLFLKRCESALSDIYSASMEVSQNQTTPSGLVRITAIADLGESELIDSITEFRKKFPKVSVDLDFSDRQVDMIAEGYDLAIRSGALTDSSYIAKMIVKGNFVLVGSIEYLKNRSPLKQPKDLLKHSCLRFTEIESDGAWKLKNKEGKIVRIKINSQISANSIRAIKRLVMLHQGIALLPQYFIHGYQAQDGLVQVLPEWSTPTQPCYLVYPSQRYLSPKVRELIPFLERALKKIWISNHSF